jgi:hypothetical protein
VRSSPVFDATAEHATIPAQRRTSLRFFMTDPRCARKYRANIKRIQCSSVINKPFRLQRFNTAQSPRPVLPLPESSQPQEEQNPPSVAAFGSSPVSSVSPSARQTVVFLAWGELRMHSLSDCHRTGTFTKIHVAAFCPRPIFDSALSKAE